MEKKGYAKKGKLILPRDYIYVRNPIIFLAGPIQGAFDWQAVAIQCIQTKAPELHIASPRINSTLKLKPGEFTQEMFEEQVDWETYYLGKSGRGGCILFYLQKEALHDRRRAYAQTSRFEYGEWLARKSYEPNINLVIGYEKDYTGLRYLQRRLQTSFKSVPLCTSLEDTCDKAIELVRNLPK